MNINERAVRANGDETEFEALLREYRPFIASCVYKTAGKHTDMHDDAMSVGIIAFEEAVRRYKPESGSFLSYAANVIRCRLIDHLRAERPKMQVVSLESMTGDDALQENYRDRLEHENLSQLPQSRFEDPLKLEIEQLTNALKAYGLRFADVAKCSPRARKTKAACRKAARAIVDDRSLFGSLRSSGRLPAVEIEKITGVSRKTIARHRSYIVCLAEMLSGEYVYLAGYAKCTEEGEAQ